MEAATLYGEALEKNNQDATIWCNRAFARMNLVSIDLRLFKWFKLKQ